MKTRVSIDLDISTYEAWQRVGEQWGDTGEWASNLTSSYLDTDKVQVGSTRVCRIKDDTLVERLRIYNPDEMTFAHELIDPPSFVISVLNTFTVQSRGEHESTVSSNVSMEVKWWMRPLTPLLSLYLGRVLKGALEEFKHWAETGNPHPRKVAHSEKHAAWRTPEVLLVRDS